MKLLKSSILLSGSVLLLAATSAKEVNQSASTKKENRMNLKSNKETIRKLYEECLNKRNYDLLKNLVSEEYSGPRGEKGAAGLEATVKPLIIAFPDIQWKIEDLLEDQDKVVIRWSWMGTHKEPFNSFAATNKSVKNEAIAIYQLKDGKISSAYLQSDRLGFLQQIGVIATDIIPGGPKK